MTKVRITENWTPSKCSGRFQSAESIEVPRPFFNCSWINCSISLILSHPAHGKICPHNANTALECDCYEVLLHELDLEKGSCTDFEGQKYNFPCFSEEKAKELMLISRRRGISVSLSEEKAKEPMLISKRRRRSINVS